MPLQRGKQLAMCILVAPIIILYCFLLAVPVSASTWYQQIYHHILPTSQSRAYLCSQLIHSFWSHIIAILCIFKILANYHIVLKQFVYNIMQLTDQFHFQFIAKENFPGSFHPQQDIGCPMKKLKTQKQLPRSAVLKKKNNNDASGNECKQQANLKQQSSESKASADWVVVKSENKKKKRSASLTPVDNVSSEPQQRRHSSAVTISTKSSTKTAKKSMNNNKQNTKCRNKTPGQDLNQKQSKTTTTTTSPVSRSQPWANIVKKEECHSHDDVPCLSDTESTTESVESPCISHQELSHHSTGTKRYYSPFSTGFDLGLSLQATKETHAELEVCQNNFSINSRLDEYLNTQQRQYTHKKSILNLLNPTSQFETTITPTCFKYFDDMMMSTSLYYHIEEEIPSPVLYNKKDWYAIH